MQLGKLLAARGRLMDVCIQGLQHRPGSLCPRRSMFLLALSLTGLLWSPPCSVSFCLLSHAYSMFQPRLMHSVEHFPVTSSPEPHSICLCPALHPRSLTARDAWPGCPAPTSGLWLGWSLGEGSHKRSEEGGGRWGVFIPSAVP